MQAKKSKENNKIVLCSIILVYLFNSTEQNAFLVKPDALQNIRMVFNYIARLSTELAPSSRSGRNSILVCRAMLHKIYTSIRRAA